METHNDRVRWEIHNAYEHVFVYHVVNTRINLQFLDASYHPFLVKLAMENTRTHTHITCWLKGQFAANPNFSGKTHMVSL